MRIATLRAEPTQARQLPRYAVKSNTTEENDTQPLHSSHVDCQFLLDPVHKTSAD